MDGQLFRLLWVHLIPVQPPTWCSVLVVESEELAVRDVGALLPALGDGRDVVQLRGRLHLEVLAKKKGGVIRVQTSREIHRTFENLT